MDRIDDDTYLATLANGVRVLVVRMPGRPLADVSVFVHTGSQHEARRAGFVDITLGARVLRADTAPLAALAVLGVPTS